MTVKKAVSREKKASVRTPAVRGKAGSPSKSVKAATNPVPDRRGAASEHVLEMQLQRERSFLDTILDTVAALILVVDPEGRLVRFNGACSRLTGYDFSDFQGNAAWQDLIPAEEAEDVISVIEKLRSRKKPVLHENHWVGRDGVRHLICWRNSVILDDAGKVQYIIGTGVDITEQDKAEHKARESLEAASRLQRLQTANELATVLAHELNQPLAAIASYAEAGLQLLSHKPLEQDKLIQNLDKISKQSLRAGETIRHMRTFVGRGRIDPVPMDLNAVVDRTCTLMIPKAHSRGIKVELDLDKALPLVMGGEVHIEQVLLNLIRNAVDAIRDVRMKSGCITIRTQQKDGMAQVSVVDTGPGFDAEKVDKLFEPLTSKKEYGLGVGLRISRSLIEAHHGRLWAEPHSPGGIFHFVLPFAS